MRKAVRARGRFPNETTALKCVPMALMSLNPTGNGRKSWTMRWKAASHAVQLLLGKSRLASDEPDAAKSAWHLASAHLTTLNDPLVDKVKAKLAAD
jgi:hypothetical protein